MRTFFLSYRRDDSPGQAGRLFDALVGRFGKRRVFQDVATIRAGEDFTEAIDVAIASSDAVLVVIGPNWLPSRLHEPDDFVRIELAAAFSRGVLVVPVLVAGRTELPPESELPDAIKPLATRHRIVLHDETWEEDVGGLINALAPSKLPAWWPAAIAAAIAVALFAAIWAVVVGGGEDDTAEAPDADLVCPTPESNGWTQLELLPGDLTADVSRDGELLRFTATEAHSRPIAGDAWEVILSMAMRNLSDEDRYHASWRYDGLALDGVLHRPTCFHVTGRELVGFDRVSPALVGFELPLDPAGGTLVLDLEDGRIDLAS